MKLLSASPFKKSLLMAIAILAIAAGSWAFAQDQGPPRRGTAEAAQCLLRQGPKGCEKMFEARARIAAQPWVWANPRRDFNRGPLESGRYWGEASESNAFDAMVLIRQAANEMDIYDVKFAHQEWTFYISPADADGKIRHLAIRLYAPHDLNQLFG